MRIPTLIGSLALTANTAFAAYSIVNNKCHYPVWVSSVQTTRSELQKIQPGDTWSEKQKFAEDGTGVNIQVVNSEDAFGTSKPILNMQYSYGGGLWYSLSSAVGPAFVDEKVRIHNTDGLPVQEIVWIGDHRPENVASYPKGEANLTLELCDDFKRRFKA
ncbi:hypothetical protein AA0112_g8743 [Alternaria arborescens]|jgi:hypothetical protein|uniref:hypothetical protein n=1 Tax=Alternaria arborescens TaxID=156630 RepID=UPI00107519C7|nr:hypothetical protein AA0111_g1371 [Alternaria arborescens]RYN24935.1 hypothetical protein AA0112_g8743 [Alternaria arborescens]RYO40817.1 hypothetical protein AA0111_g1371 [Alternaria arborescens]